MPQVEQNARRAECADHALAEFAAQVGMNVDAEMDTAIGDLIGDLLHLAVREGFDPMAIVKQGIGMWSAEHNAPDGEPYANDLVEISITQDERNRASEETA